MLYDILNEYALKDVINANETDLFLKCVTNKTLALLFIY